MMDVIFDRGTFLPECDLWLDPRGTRPFAFVSHAHSDHTGHHQRTILTDATARFMRARLGSSGKVQHALRYGEERDFGSFRATLLPAGHVLGSAQILIEKGGERLLYTGDFKLRPGLSSEPAESALADTLIMETTFGRPKYLFPPAAKTIARIQSFCQKALAEGEVPVLLGYSLGKAQEVLSALAETGFPLMLHGSIWQMTQLYEGLGVVFPPYVRFEPEQVEGHVLICPPATAGSAMLEKIPKKRVAMITGWGIDERAMYRYQCDEVFPLSDHADYSELLEMVDLVKPSRVFTLHGFADEFASDLRRRGIDAWSLTGGNQIEFPI
jgi:Cft2 family RNA processing exonuclease